MVDAIAAIVHNATPVVPRDVLTVVYEDDTAIAPVAVPFVPVAVTHDIDMVRDTVVVPITPVMFQAVVSVRTDGRPAEFVIDPKTLV